MYSWLVTIIYINLMSVKIYLHCSHLLSTTKCIHVFLSVICYILMIKCEHCGVDAYYRLTVEDFNSAEVYAADLCLKCIKIEDSKAIGDFPVTRSLKIEPLFSTLAASVHILSSHVANITSSEQS